MGVSMSWEGDLRKVDRANAGAIVAVHYHFFGHFNADIFLRFLS